MNVSRPHAMTARCALVALLGVSACDSNPVTPITPDLVAPVQGGAGVTAYLSLSVLQPRAGDRVTVGLNAVRGGAAEPIGSFTMRVTYDTTGLRFVASDQSAEGMVLANAAHGVVTVAGASGSGFRESDLAALTMVVIDPDALRSLALEVVEMNAASFADQRAGTVVDHQLHRRPLSR